MANFSRPYDFLKQRGLISEEVRNHQYRFKEIIDPDNGQVLSFLLNTKFEACATRCSAVFSSTVTRHKLSAGTAGRETR